MIGIRADANLKIASGHVMRCITIAKEIIARSGSVVFFVADEESKELLDTFAKGICGIEAVVLGTDWQDMEGEIPCLKKELTTRDVDVLLVDSYQVTPEYFKELSQVCRTAYMDDLAKEAYPVDLLINYSGFSDQLGYEELYGGAGTGVGRQVQFLLGLMYAPLREQFRTSENGEAALCGGGEKLNILLTAGGGDIRGMIMPVLMRAHEAGLIGKVGSKEGCKWHVVLGSMVENAAEIAGFADSHGDITVYRNVMDMAAVMKKCDIAVAAAGTVLTECAALRLPVIFYQVADNQKINVSYWDRSGGMIFAGDVTSGDETSKSETVSNIIGSIREFEMRRDKLKDMSDSLNGFTDGRGAERIALALLRLNT